MMIGSPSQATAHAGADRSSRRLDDDLDHHSFHTGPLRWLPVADATDDSHRPQVR